MGQLAMREANEEDTNSSNSDGNANGGVAEGAGEEEDDDEGEAADKPRKQLYPKGLYEKMQKFYATHDPAKLETIARDNVQVDEEQLDADLKRRFGMGLDSVE